jgi:hypothetical protein
MPKAGKRREFEELQDKDKSKWVKPPRDPAVDQVVELVRNYTTHRLYMNSFLSKSTIYKLRKNGHDATRRPQHLTLVGVLGAAGYEYVVRRKK